VRPLGRPLFNALGTRYAGASTECYIDAGSLGNPVGSLGQLDYSACAWFYLVPDQSTSVSLVHTYTFDADEIIKVGLFGNPDTGQPTSRFGVYLANHTSGNGQTLFSTQPTLPGWVFVAFSTPTASGNPVRAYLSALNEDRWHVALSANMTSTSTKPDLLYLMSGNPPGLRAAAHHRWFNWSLTHDEWRIEKWRFRPSGREWAWFPLGASWGKNLIDGTKPLVFSQAANMSPIPGPATYHEMLACRRRRTPLDYRFASPSADVSNSGWTRVP
jgi:hypothetical protein